MHMCDVLYTHICIYNVHMCVCISDMLYMHVCDVLYMHMFCLSHQLSTANTQGRKKRGAGSDNFRFVFNSSINRLTSHHLLNGDGQVIGQVDDGFSHTCPHFFIF